MHSLGEYLGKCAFSWGISWANVHSLGGYLGHMCSLFSGGYLGQMCVLKKEVIVRLDNTSMLLPYKASVSPECEIFSINNKTVIEFGSRKI